MGQDVGTEKSSNAGHAIGHAMSRRSDFRRQEFRRGNPRGTFASKHTSMGQKRQDQEDIGMSIRMVIFQ